MNHLDHEAASHTDTSTADFDRLIAEAFSLANQTLAEHGIQTAAEDIYSEASFRMEVEEHIENSGGKLPTAVDLGMWLSDECVFASQTGDDE